MRNTRSRRVRRLPFGAIIAVLLAAYCATITFWPIQAVNAEITSSAQINTGTPPEISWPPYGQSAIGTTNDGILATSGTQSSVPMASITKIVTALVVLDKKPIPQGQTGPAITFTAEDAARYNQYFMVGGTIARSDADMQLTQYQILQGMLVNSANNYADTLAIWAYGSMDAYLAAARTYLTKHNLSNTSVADATGFSPESRSSASDLIRLGTLALEQPAIAEIVSKKSVAIPGVGILNNTNLLVGQDGIIGIKTGTTDEAGSCLLFAAKYVIGDSHVTIVGATLGGPNHVTLARDVNKVLASTKTGFQEVTLARLNQQFAVYKAPWGSQSKAVANKNTKVVAWPGTSVSQKVTATSLQANTHPPSSGSVIFSVGNKQHASELVLDKPLEKPSLLWKLTHPKQVIRN